MCPGTHPPSLKCQAHLTINSPTGWLAIFSSSAETQIVQAPNNSNPDPWGSLTIFDFKDFSCLGPGKCSPVQCENSAAVFVFSGIGRIKSQLALDAGLCASPLRSIYLSVNIKSPRGIRKGAAPNPPHKQTIKQC